MKLAEIKFIQIGLGSMGKRRIRNLLYHGISRKKIIGFDINTQRNEEVRNKYDIVTSNDYKKAINLFKPDVYIISTPPNLHYRYFLQAARLKKHFFVEVTTTNRGYQDLFKFTSKNDFVAAPSSTFRYFKPVKKIKSILENNKLGRMLTYSLHLGQYLPYWHPWEDYHQVYFSKKETGACREMLCYELIWLNWLVRSEIKKVGGIITKISDLDIDADDILMGLIEYKNKVLGNITIDIISHKPMRILRIICQKGVVEWDWLNSKIKVFDLKMKKDNLIFIKPGEKVGEYLASENMYQDEIGVFLDAILGKKHYPYTFKENNKIIEILETLEKSSNRNQFVKIN